jgi:hypothetical protein
MNLDAAEPFLGCPAEQLYVVESVLEQMIPFVRSTMIAAGWAAESASGYTLVALFERQLLHVKWVRKQGELELTTMLADAQTSFVEALGACDASHLRMLNHPEPEPAGTAGTPATATMAGSAATAGTAAIAATAARAG